VPAETVLLRHLLLPVEGLGGKNVTEKDERSDEDEEALNSDA